MVLPAGGSVDEVHLGSGDPLGFEPELVSEEHDEEEWDREIIRDEVCCVPVATKEHTPVGEEDDDDGPAQTPPGGIWCEPAMPWEVLWVDTLRLQALSESDTGETDTEPVEHPGDGTHVGEPVESSVRGLGNSHVGQGGEKGTKAQCVNGGSLRVGAGEEFGGLTGLSKAIEGTGRGVQI